MTTAANKFMWTTNIPVSKTIAELSSTLVAAGARHISQTYGESGHITGLSFMLHVDGLPVYFKLPARTERLFERINGQRKRQQTQHAEDDRRQAEKIAWRQLLRWTEAQCALCETGMVQAHEVFLPYAQDRTGKTLFENLQAGKFKALSAPEGK